MTLTTDLLCQLEDGASVRQRRGEDFPLVLGGRNADIPVSGVESQEPSAFLGLSEGRLFVEPSGSFARVSVNGAVLTTSRWLDSGDRIRVGHTEIECNLSPGKVRLAIHGVVVEGSGEIRAPAVSGTTIRPEEFRPRSLKDLRPRRRRFRPVALLVLALVLALSMAAGYVFTARSVSLRVEPTPDRLELRGGLLRLELADRYLLRPGHYRVWAEKEGYKVLDDVVEVGDEATQAFDFALELLPGRLFVTSGEVSGAQVRVDGKALGKTPLGPLELSPGRHEIEIMAPRYRVLSQEVEIQGGDLAQRLVVQLEPAWAEVSFQSDPDGAEVRIDGEPQGETPLELELGAGGHDVEMAHSGFKKHMGRVEVVAGEPQEYPRVELVPADGVVRLSSTPAGAIITLDGEYSGQTPLRIVLAPGRDHRLELSKAGHRSRATTLRVDPEEERNLALDLEEIRGELRIESWPEDARLWVNGEDVGVANQSLMLPSLPHDIEVRKDGFEPFRTTLTPHPEYPELLSVVLKTPSEARAAAIPRVVRSPQGQEMLLVDPGLLRMGAPRREPGRRSNEVTRQVELTRPFYMAVGEVSNRQLREFKASHKSGKVGSVSLETDHHPAVRVSWEDAARYCNWLSGKDSLQPAYVEKDGRLVGVSPMTRGYRLPTEAEWAWVARFAGGRSLKYPWGDSLPVPEGSSNYGDALPGYRDPYPGTGPVGELAPNALGIYNLGGNASEWMHDIYAVRPSQGSEVEQDPMGPEEGRYHVIRGSSWMTTNVTRLRLSCRDYSDEARPDLGFRIVRYAE